MYCCSLKQLHYITIKWFYWKNINNFKFVLLSFYDLSNLGKIMFFVFLVRIFFFLFLNTFQFEKISENQKSRAYFIFIIIMFSIRHTFFNLNMNLVEMWWNMLKNYICRYCKFIKELETHKRKTMSSVQKSFD